MQKLSTTVQQKEKKILRSIQTEGREREREMMNLLALGLVLTSLVTAGFFTPNPEKHKSTDDVIVKEGHRVVVVEYEKDDGNTKVSISPQDSQTLHKVEEKGFPSNVNDKLSEKMGNVKEGIKEASSSILPDEGKEESLKEGNHQRFRARELVCDAYGRCKHKIARVIGKTSEAAAEKAHEAAEKVSDMEEAVKEAAGDAASKVKETVTHTAQKVSDKVQEAKENVKDSASEVSTKTKEKLSEKASGIKEEASKKMEGAKATAKEASYTAKKGSERVRKEGKKELSEILHHAREVAVDVSDLVFSAKRVAPLTGVVHLMGFSAAYGMCVWVTFASSQVLAGALPRQQFAMVQSRIYPVYFKAMAYSVGMALLGHLMSPRKRLSGSSVGWFQGFNLMAALGMILVNLLYLEPRATKVMLERMKKEKEEGRGKEAHTAEPVERAPGSTAETAGRGSITQETAAKSQIIRLSETLQRLNSYSSFLNVMTLVSLTWHLVRLGPHLHAVR